MGREAGGRDDVIAMGAHAMARRVGCPKRMVFGPCGGVRSGGGCEVDERPCPFVPEPAPTWPTDVEPDGERRADREDAPHLHRGGAGGSALVAPIVVCDGRPAE